MSLKVGRAFRNAFALVARRYEVTQQVIVEAAPLLFLIAAEQCLQQRRKRLDELRNAAAALSLTAPSHLPLDYPVDFWRALKAEKRSIEERDLFGTIVELAVGVPQKSERDETADAEFRGFVPTGMLINPNNLGWKEDVDNPFSAFLNAALVALGRRGEGVQWSEAFGPAYRICIEEAKNLVGGDAEAINAILLGVVPLHEMPADIRKASPAERALQIPTKSPGQSEIMSPGLTR